MHLDGISVLWTRHALSNMQVKHCAKRTTTQHGSIARRWFLGLQILICTYGTCTGYKYRAYRIARSCACARARSLCVPTNRRRSHWVLQSVTPTPASQPAYTLCMPALNGLRLCPYMLARAQGLNSNVNMPGCRCFARFIPVQYYCK